ncbi:MAG: hypothetical protein J3R72DRAFT_446166 [Linnemannia gamsii]|nr:MAG: hypothetical protein J3R72DRAFT_446166 [Linnemannia gamsii]
MCVFVYVIGVPTSVVCSCCFYPLLPYFSLAFLFLSLLFPPFTVSLSSFSPSLFLFYPRPSSLPLDILYALDRNTTFPLSCPTSVPSIHPHSLFLETEESGQKAKTPK